MPPTRKYIKSLCHYESLNVKSVCMLIDCPTGMDRSGLILSLNVPTVAIFGRGRL